MVLVPISLAQAKKPLKFEVSGVQTPDGWIGTVDSGPLAGKTMIWYSNVVIFRHKNVYFFEEWEIWDEDTLVLAGYDEGVTVPHARATGNGIVTYVNPDYPDYTHLIGRKEHFTGFLTGPTTFEGTVQIN